jgi:hypothetical protein
MDQVSLTSAAVLLVKVEAFMVRTPKFMMAPPFAVVFIQVVLHVQIFRA